MFKNIPTIRHVDRYFAQYMVSLHKDNHVALASLLLSHYNEKGDVCIGLANYAERLLFSSEEFEGVVAPSLARWLLSLQQHPWVADKSFPSPLVLDGDNVYMGKYWFAEQNVVKSIIERSRQRPKIDIGLLSQGLQQYFDGKHPTPNWQAIAASVAVQSGFSVISGGPGTGKTTTVLSVLALLLAQNSNINIALCAPTGKAAVRLSQSIAGNVKKLSQAVQKNIPTEVKTIHRLLKYSVSKERFSHNKDNPLMVDVLIVDEVSMVDLFLMDSLLNALPVSTKVILLGDKDQLPSVEAGCVMSDLTGKGQAINHSDVFMDYHQRLALDQGVDENAAFWANSPNAFSMQNYVVELKHSYRFDAHSGIGQLAKLINRQQGGVAFNHVINSLDYDDCQWQDLHKGEQQTALVGFALRRYLPYMQQSNVADALTQFDSFRVLCAVRSGNCGVEQLNLQIKQGLVKHHGVDDAEIYHTMPIMINQNDYESGLYNGDTGLIWQDASGTLAAYFPDVEGVKKVALSRLPHYELAYAITVHKSQGSEFNHVLLCLPNYSNENLSKELVYTGVTRAKENITLFATKEHFIQACSTSNSRQSGMAKKLGW